jgi:hypothetical protein
MSVCAVSYDLSVLETASDSSQPLRQRPEFRGVRTFVKKVLRFFPAGAVREITSSSQGADEPTFADQQARVVNWTQPGTMSATTFATGLSISIFVSQFGGDSSH